MGPNVHGSAVSIDLKATEGNYAYAPIADGVGCAKGFCEGLALRVLTGEALGHGPWLTNALFRAFQNAASARGEAPVHLDDELASNEK